jgi:urea transport system ATP-binding protein
VPLSCLALLGRNGAGKTTLLRTIMGVMPAAGGRIAFAGEDITRAPSHRRARAGIGYVPQGREIFADLTVGQNIEIVLRNQRTPEPDAARDEIVALFPCSGRCGAGAAATSRAASSSSSPSAARSPGARSS